MKIEPLSITVRELVDGFADHAENGVVAFHGTLDVRPKYQREFIYSEKQQQAVINTVTKGYPLNVMYWAVRDDSTFEVIDGQQRTLSLCEYAAVHGISEACVVRAAGRSLPDVRAALLLRGDGGGPHRAMVKRRQDCA